MWETRAGIVMIDQCKYHSLVNTKAGVGLTLQGLITLPTSQSEQGTGDVRLGIGTNLNGR